MKIKYFNSDDLLCVQEKGALIEFLYRSLEQYGDSKSAIEKSIDYAMDESAGKGGLVGIMYDSDTIIGAAVINFTGMQGFIPENFLVYIALDRTYRGKGLGKELLSKIIDRVDGDIALHVEPDNPALRLYESFGFTNKYLEMRLIRRE